MTRSSSLENGIGRSEDLNKVEVQARIGNVSKEFIGC
jgi:hypothetical protein